MPVELPANAEKAAISYLAAAYPGAGFTGVTVATRVPNPRPAGALVVVRRDGGGIADVVTDVPRLNVQVWDATVEGAHDLAVTTAQLLAEASGVVAPGVSVREARLFSLSNVPDSATDSPRWVITCQWATRREP
ncbi:MAG TPA: hypothetical protein VFH80_28315 [Solirubrobacteraceae bacterium]|nr:hypothetical protein [Solirubrobacteraceae bacterium]